MKKRKMGNSSNKRALARIDVNKVESFPSCESIARVVRVIDGDTIRMLFLVERHPFQLNVRLKGVDCAELRVPQERPYALKTRDIVRSLMPKDSICKVQLHGWDKYGGRVVGTVTPENFQITLNDWLLENHCALPMDKRRRSTEDKIEAFKHLLADEKPLVS